MEPDGDVHTYRYDKKELKNDGTQHIKKNNKDDKWLG